MDYSDNDSHENFWALEPSVDYVAKPNAFLEKSFAFAIRIVKLYQWLRKYHPDIGPLSTQILKCGTSVGANANEADSAFSKREFASKLGISLKEARESRYWLRVLRATEYLDEPLFISLNTDCDELI